MYRSRNRIFWGIVFILSAVFLIISKMGYLEDFSVLSIVFSVFLGAIIFKSIYPPRFAGILFPLAILAIIFDKQLGIENLTPWTVLAVALLGSIGLTMLFHNKKWHHHYCCRNDEEIVIDVEDNSNVRHRTSFGASAKYINSDDFKQADLECSFGAMKVYFDKAKVNDGNAVIRLNVSFSGVELYLPKEWTIDNQINVSLGAVEEKNKNQPTGEVMVTLVGEVSLGAVEITYI